MEERLTKEELLAKAAKPARDAMRMHPYYRGKIEVVPKCVIRDIDDFAVWYTPGVAETCKDIEKDPERVFRHTNKGNMVAIVTDGTRVLGLGDIGPLAGLPVMEGKAFSSSIWAAWTRFPSASTRRTPMRSSTP